MPGGYIYIPVWIDLKLPPYVFSLTAINHLHSSMDRFEEGGDTVKDKLNIIYIPVWIDLKLPMLTKTVIQSINLHSSMDRFEA